KGGMLLYKIFEPDAPPGDVSLEFQLPGSARVLRIDGVVLQSEASVASRVVSERASPARMPHEKEHARARSQGVRFVRMAEEDRDLLERYLRDELQPRLTSTVDG